jgi:flavoprotein
MEQSFAAVTVLHIELAKRNQLLLVAPLCANALASMALGLCGNLVESVARAWYYDLDPAFAEPLAAKLGAHLTNRPVWVVCLHRLMTACHRWLLS